MRLPDELPGLTKPPPIVKLTPREFDELLEYSTTLPTGTTIGKRWKRNQNMMRYPICSHLDPWSGTKEPDFRGEPDWWMGEFIPDPDPKRDRDGKPLTIGIRWSKIEVVRPTSPT